MTELDSSVKTIMEILGKLDELLEDESELNTDLEFPSIFEQIYRRVVSAESRGSIYHPGRSEVSGTRIAVIPGTNAIACMETLLVCIFPVFHGLGERYPNNVAELRLNEARKYVETCPNTKNVIFYGPVWDSTLWKMHKSSFANCNTFLKLFFTVYSKLKK